MPFARMVQRGFDCGIEFIADARIVAVNFAASRPVQRAIRGQTAADRVDAECKKLIEGGIERSKPESTAAQKIPIEGVYVAEVENETMPFGDGTIVKSLFADQRKDFAGTRARAQQSGLQVVANADCGRSSHGLSPSFGCGFREKDTSKNRRRGGSATLRC